MKKEIKLLREKLADLEHRQWAYWTIYFLRNLEQENFDRWARQVKTDYKDLTEKEKDSDRIWADKVLEIFQNTLKDIKEEIEEKISCDYDWQNNIMEIIDKAFEKHEGELK